MFDIKKHSVPKNQFENSEEAQAQKQRQRELGLYRNRVLIDRESTKRLEMRTLSHGRDSDSLSPNPDLLDGGLIRDYEPGS